MDEGLKLSKSLLFTAAPPNYIYLLFLMIMRKLLLALLMLSSNLISAQIVSNDEGFFKSGNCKLYYKVIGQGKPLIVIHGGPGLDHSYFLPQLEKFSKEYQLIFFDQRGCGRSCTDIGQEEVSLLNMAMDIEALREYFKLEQVNLLAHSFGALIAMKYSILYPAKVASMILMNPTAASSRWRDSSFAQLSKRRSPDEQKELNSIREEAGFVARDAVTMSRFFKVLFRPSFYNPQLAEELNMDLSDTYPKTSFLMDALHQDPELQHYDFHDSLKVLKIPTLIFGAEADISSPMALEQLHASLRRSEYIFLESCGHFAFIEQPEAILLGMRRFYSKY